jgi:hypothetical protein
MRAKASLVNKMRRYLGKQFSADRRCPTPAFYVGVTSLGGGTLIEGSAERTFDIGKGFHFCDIRELCPS